MRKSLTIGSAKILRASSKGSFGPIVFPSKTFDGSSLRYLIMALTASCTHQKRLKSYDCYIGQSSCMKDQKISERTAKVTRWWYLDDSMIKKHTDIAERYAYRKQHDDVPYRHTLQHSQKLEFYSIFKSDYAPSVYLDFRPEKFLKEALWWDLRIGQHKLLRSVRQVDTRKYRGVNDFALSASSILSRMKSIFY